MSDIVAGEIASTPKRRLRRVQIASIIIRLAHGEKRVGRTFTWRRAS